MHRQAELAPGVFFSRLADGGKDGPENVVRDDPQLGGGIFGDAWFVGSDSDPFRLSFTDVRMARNQYWPAHWHGCWIAVIVFDGQPSHRRQVDAAG